MTDAKFCGCGLAMKNEIMCQCGLRGPWDTICRYRPKTKTKPANKELINVLERTIQAQSSRITELEKQMTILKRCVETLISRSGAVPEEHKAQEKKRGKHPEEKPLWALCIWIRSMVRVHGSLAKAEENDCRTREYINLVYRKRLAAVSWGIDFLTSEYLILPASSPRMS